MTEATEPNILGATFEATAGWRSRVRVNVAKTATKGYTSDTTVEVEWFGADAEWDVDARQRLAELLETSDDIARSEIGRREQLDAEPAS